jgi:endoglucanase
MDLLQVRGGKIVDSANQPVRLRGANVGGWMNMENFINGYPGSEHGIRAAMAAALGPEQGAFFFERLLDYFLAEDDIRFMRECGATAVRLPLNYRHFERDNAPFQYLEAGFARLDKALAWCAKHELYAILDLHAVQGWQNTDWHSDNAGRQAFFWQQAQFQDRFVALWQALATRYAGNPIVAGYDLMNEPVTNAPDGRFNDAYTPDYAAINAVYRRVVAAIREVDPAHILFLEGDYFGSRFAGLDPPFADNLAYSSHNYSAAGFGPGAYPGVIGGAQWNRDTYAAHMAQTEAVRFARRHNVPLWVGEFGAVYNGPPGEAADRARAMDDQIDVFEELGLHWSTWTFKDVGIMGWVQLPPESPYVRRIAHILEAKRLLDTDFWMGWLPSTPAKEQVAALTRLIEETIGDPTVHAGARYVGQAVLDNYAGGLMQPAYANCFKGLSRAELDELLASFALANCRPYTPLIDIIKKHTARPA